MTILPWNESERPPTLEVVVTASMQDTTQVDAYRQGVEMRNTRDLVLSTQPKLWGGESNRYGVLSHENSLPPEALGQPGSWTSYEGTVQWSDTQAGWDPVRFMRFRASYLNPVWVDLGPEGRFEAGVEPLDIGGRRGIPGVRVLEVHQARGEADLTTAEHEFRGGTLGAYLDIEANLTGSLRPNRWNPSSLGTTSPYHDEEDWEVVDDHIIGGSVPLVATLRAMKVNLDQDIDLRHKGHKSAPAGRDVYGPGQARVGTDSLAFLGTTRGS